MNLPYGTADFATLRRGNYFYVDKTVFIPRLEDARWGRRHLLFLRPRRFGKTTLVSMLEQYYDVGRAESVRHISPSYSPGGRQMDRACNKFPVL